MENFWKKEKKFPGIFLEKITLKNKKIYFFPGKFLEKNIVFNLKNAIFFNY